MTEYQGYAPTAPMPIASADVDVRFDYMKRTYGLLLGGIAAFVALEVVLFTLGIGDAVGSFLANTTIGWLAVLGGFSLLSWLATSFAVRARSRAEQLLAYGVTVVAQAVIFLPMLWLATEFVSGAVGQAAAISTIGFLGLSGIAITSSRDFSFLGAILKWVGVVALVLIVVSVFTGFNLGAWFSVAMIAFAGAAILWDTQRILRDFPEGTEVLAAMQLFASVMLLFWYVLRLVMSFARD